MALAITSACLNCFACEPLCPNEAIAEAQPHFRIDAVKCSECMGYYDAPQCAEICPIEGAIVDAVGRPLNPLGSLTGIPWNRRAETRKEPRTAEGELAVRPV